MADSTTTPDELTGSVRAPDTGDDRLSSLSQERSRRTRAKLVDIALGLWGERGFDDTSVDELCDAAGVAKGTFYFYFRAKEDLLIELGFGAAESMIVEVHRAIADDATTREVLARSFAELASAVAPTPNALLERSVEEIFHSLGKRWQQAKTGRPHFREILTLVFTRGQERGEIDAGVGAGEIAGIMTMVMLQGLLDWSRIEEDTETLVALLERRTRIVLEDAVLRS
jgi:AcrR family transcriptional regulator